MIGMRNKPNLSQNHFVKSNRLPGYRNSVMELIFFKHFNKSIKAALNLVKVS